MTIKHTTNTHYLFIRVYKQTHTQNVQNFVWLLNGLSMKSGVNTGRNFDRYVVTTRSSTAPRPALIQ